VDVAGARAAARSEGPKHELLARLKATNQQRRALFFCAFVGMSLANEVFRAAKLVVLLSDYKECE
jgi:hypothetical protein